MLRIGEWGVVGFFWMGWIGRLRRLRIFFWGGEWEVEVFFKRSVYFLLMLVGLAVVRGHWGFLFLLNGIFASLFSCIVATGWTES